VLFHAATLLGRLRRCVLPGLLALVAAFPVGAQVFVPAPARKDMVHDAARGVVYITAGDRVLRYSVKYGTFAAPLVFGGDLRGIDLSPDGRTLVVADGLFRKSRAWVWLVDLETEVARQAFLPTSAYYETGTFSAVFGADGKVYTTSSCSCSGWMPMRKLDPATGAWTELASLRDDSMLVPSGDAGTIAFAQVDTSDGSYGLLRVGTGEIVHRQGSGNATGRFNWEIGTNRSGDQFVLPTHGGAFVFGADYARLAILGASTLAKPAGVAYHPVEPEFYVPMSYSGQLVAHDAATLAPVRSWPLFYRFALPTYWTIDAYDVARTRISRDGSLVMVSVPGGVALVQQYAPLRADTLAAEVPAGGSVDLALAGSVGNGGQLDYSLPDTMGGRASLVGGFLRYQAAANASGWVQGRYRAHYGRAVAEGAVWIHVVAAAQPKPKPAPVRRAARGVGGGARPTR
jgi:hypothetical protein